MLTAFVASWGIWRDELPEAVQPPYLMDMQGWLPWWAWVQIVLVIMLLAVFEGAHRAIIEVRTSAGLRDETDEHAIVDEIESLGYLEIMHKGEREFLSLPKVIEAITQRLSKTNAEMQDYAAKMPDDIPGRIKIGNHVSRSLGGFASFFDKKVTSLEKKAVYSIRLWSEFTRRADISTTVERKQLTDFIEVLRKTYRETKEVPNQARGFRTAMDNMRRDPPTQRLREQCERTIRILDRWIVLFDEMRDGMKAAFRIGDQRFNPQSVHDKAESLPQ